METNRFMLEYASICPEITHQKLDSQRVYLTLLTMNKYKQLDNFTYMYLIIANKTSY